MTADGAVRVVDDPAELVAHFSDDPRLHIYALADLAEPVWSASRWWRRGPAVVGLVVLPDAGHRIVYAVSSRAPEATTRLLVELEAAFPAGTLVTAPSGAADALDAVRPCRWRRPYERYWLPEDVELPPAAPPAGFRLVELGTDDGDRLRALYLRQPDAAFFLPSMLADRTFVGCEVGGDLVAVAGTHVVSSSIRRPLAAIGAVFTDPDHRGRGLGRLVTLEVCHRLRQRSAVIGLNCAVANTPAASVYRRLGFEALLRYDELELGPAPHRGCVLHPTPETSGLT